MTHKETGGPAFPTVDTDYCAAKEGMTLRQHAAIKLRVPDSGTEWLDEMICEAKRDDFAGQALPSLLSHSGIEELASKKGLLWVKLVAEMSYHMADAMNAARDAE